MGLVDLDLALPPRGKLAMIAAQQKFAVWNQRNRGVAILTSMVMTQNVEPEIALHQPGSLVRIAPPRIGALFATTVCPTTTLWSGFTTVLMATSLQHRL
jgi:hypothetical protein